VRLPCDWVCAARPGCVRLVPGGLYLSFVPLFPDAEFPDADFDESLLALPPDGLAVDELGVAPLAD